MPLTSRNARTLPARGDHDAFGRFYRRHESAITAYVRRRVGSPELAADITMEVFAAALLAIHDDHAQPADPVAWLFGIARNKLVDAHRRGAAEDRARRRLGLDLVVLSDEDIDRIDALADDGAVLALLAGLPEEQRAAISARIFDDHGYDHIAAQAGTSRDVIRQRVSRGLRTLRAQLKEDR